MYSTTLQMYANRLFPQSCHAYSQASKLPHAKSCHIHVFGIPLQAAKEFLDEVNRIRTEKNQSPVAWSEAVKFLVARKFEVKRALTLFENHQVSSNDCCRIFRVTHDHT